MVFSTTPLVFHCWKSITEPGEFTQEALDAFLTEQLEEIAKIPPRLRNPAWVRNEKFAEELMEYLTC